MTSDTERARSVLNERPDGMGYFYGHYKGSRVDILPPANEDALIWRLYIDGDPVGDGYASKDLAEQAGKMFIDHWGGDEDDVENEPSGQE